MEGIEDRTAAETLRGAILEAEVDLSQAADDEFHDLALVGPVGPAVRRPRARPDRRGAAPARPGRAGRRREDGGELLVPFVRQMVPEVDLAGGFVVVELPEGLAELASPSEQPDRVLMRIDVVSIFGDYLAPLHLSLVGRAIADGLIDLRGPRPSRLHPRPAPDRRRLPVRRRAGDGDEARAVGGGPAQRAGRRRSRRPGPAGGADAQRATLHQAQAAAWSTDPRLVFACGRYEGIDSRVVEWARTRTAGGRPLVVDEVSIGDFVLAGAEAAVLVMVEAVGRLVPGVLGNEASHADDSFAPGAMERLLEGPVYTRPPVWEGLAVPEVLTSGDHGAIARWRRGAGRAAGPDLMRPGPRLALIRPADFRARPCLWQT